MDFELAGMKTLGRSLLILLLLLAPALASPTAEEAKALVDSVVEWSLTDSTHGKAPADWEYVEKHPEHFAPEFFELMHWVGTPHPDITGVEWHYGVNPLWQTQGGYVTELKVSPPASEGETQLVFLDYVVPSTVSAERPSSKYQTTWIVGQAADGKPVVKDVRYRITYPSGMRSGTVSVEMLETKARFQPPAGTR